MTPGPAIPRLLASLALGCVLAAVYWLGMDSIPRAMLAEVDAVKVAVAGRR